MSQSQQFRALVITETEPKTFSRKIETRNTDDLPAGDVLIRVHYSSLNYKDALSASGNRGVTRKFPHTPGIDAAGIVAQSSVEQFTEGEQVVVIGYDLGMNTDGGFGEYIRVPAGWVVKLPATLTPLEAMTYGTAGFTAAMSVDELVRNGVAPEDGEVLVTGATGGVGSMAVALLAKIGFNVVAATGKVESATDFLRKLGATSIISREEATDTSRPMLRSRWAGVVDCVGGEMLETALASTKSNAVVAISGLVASPKINTTVFPFILRGVRLVGIESADFPIQKRAALWQKLATDWKLDNLATLAREVTLDTLNPEIDTILAGGQTGRVIVNLT